MANKFPILGLNCPFCGSPDCAANCDEIRTVRAKVRIKINSQKTINYLEQFLILRKQKCLI